MSIRLRLALVFAAVAAVVFVLGGWLFVSVLSTAMLRNLDASLGVQADQAGQYLAVSALEPAAALGVGHAAPAPGEYLVQVIDPNGVVRGASQDANGAPLVSGPILRRARHGELALNVTIDGEASRAVAAPLTGHPGWVAVAGVPLGSLDATRSDALGQLLIAGPIFVLLAGLGAYGTARAALSPVERLRRQAARLSEQDGESALEVPATRDELAALAVTMNALLARLQRSLARQRRFVADAGHELRTPLAVLRAELELASRQGRSREELAAAVAEAADETERLAALTNDLLLLARSDSDQLALQRRPASLRSLLEASAERARLRAGELGVEVIVSAAGAVPALVDENRLAQAIDNLVGNALAYAPQQSAVTLAARAVGLDAVIQVSDAGPGFPPAFLPLAFERFSRPDNGRARSDGSTGLGLAIVRAIAEAHGGRAVAANRVDRGAIVTIDLPGAALAGGLGPERYDRAVSSSP